MPEICWHTFRWSSRELSHRLWTSSSVNHAARTFIHLHWMWTVFFRHFFGLLATDYPDTSQTIYSRLNLPLIPMAEKTACVWHEFLIKCLFCKLLRTLPVVVRFIYDKPTAVRRRIPTLPLKLLCIDYVAKTVRYFSGRVLHDFHLSCQTNGRCKTRAPYHFNIFANVACPQLYRLFWKHKACVISDFRHEVRGVSGK